MILLSAKATAATPAWPIFHQLSGSDSSGGLGPRQSSGGLRGKGIFIDLHLQSRDFLSAESFKWKIGLKLGSEKPI